MSAFDTDERRRLDSAVDARTRLFAILGDLINHVRAPVVWSALFKRYGINAVFLPVHVEADGFDVAVDALPGNAVVADVIMEPMFTPLLKTAAARGLKIHHGRNMMNFGMTLAAQFFRLPSDLEWNGGALQNIAPLANWQHAVAGACAAMRSHAALFHATRRDALR